jgi:translation initiation factor IF-1
MADRTRIVRKVDEEDDDDMETVAEDEVEAETEDDTEEEPEEAPAPKKVVATTRKVVVPPPAVKPGAKPAAKPVVAAAKKVAVPARKPARPALEEEVEEDAVPTTLTKVKKIEESQMEILASTLLNTLNNRQTLVITKLDDGKFTIALADAKVMATTSGKMRGKEYWDEVLHPDYVAWQTEWKAMTQAEKAALCKKAKVTWEHQTDPRVDAIKMADAYCRAMGISKYKAEYKERKAREAISA